MPIDVQVLEDLIKELSDQVDQFSKISDKSELRREYQKWYSQAQHLVSSHLPSGLEEFQTLYLDPNPLIRSFTTDEIDYLGTRRCLRTTLKFKDREESFRRLFFADVEQQRGILLAVPQILNIRALEVTALVTADLMEGELNEARLLLEHGFIRAAGAVAGVALEANLKLLHDQTGLEYPDKKSIVSLATNLRMHDVITLGDEKICIAIADTRNKCDHKEEKKPTEEEVEELIEDVGRFAMRVQAI